MEELDENGRSSYNQLVIIPPPLPPVIRTTTLEQNHAKVMIPIPSHQVHGLYFQYAAIGIIHAILPFLAYPIITIYLQMEGYQIVSYQQLIGLAWTCRILFGLLSDCIPIFGYRRKSWILVGWFLCMISFGLLSFSSFGDPFCNREDGNLDCYVPYSLLNATTINLNASQQGTRFIMLSMVASIGFVLVASVSDAMVVQWTYLEHEEIRSQLQAYIYGIRAVSGAIATIVVGVCLNGPRYGGSFSMSMAPNLPYAVCLVVCLIASLTTIKMIHEVKTPPIPFADALATLRSLLESPLVWQACLYRLLSTFFVSFRSTAALPMAAVWAKVSPINYAVSNVLGEILFGMTILAMGRYGMKTNWRLTIMLATAAGSLIDVCITMLTTWNYIRNEWFFTLIGLFGRAPDAVRFVVTTSSIMLIAEPGTEGLVIALVHSMSSVAESFSSSVYKYVDAFYQVSIQNMLRDTHIVQVEVTNTFAIGYVFQALSVVWLCFLPSNAQDLEKLKARSDRPSTKSARFLLATFGICLVLSLISHLLAVIPKTHCERYGGGDGIRTENGLCSDTKN